MADARERGGRRAAGCSIATSLCIIGAWLVGSGPLRLALIAAAVVFVSLGILALFRASGRSPTSR